MFVAVAFFCAHVSFYGKDEQYEMRLVDAT